MNEWKPIDSAPKDGTRILVALDNGDIATDQWLLEHLAEYVEISPGLYRKQEKVVVHGFEWPQATHWMLPPAPPQEQS